jgi:hypothetical protein
LRQTWLRFTGTIARAGTLIHSTTNDQEGIMSIGSDFGQILDKYSNPSAPADQPQVEQDFDHITQNAEPEMLEQGLSHAFRSDQTPPFGNMVGQMFGQADSGQRAGMLNQLIGALGPAVIGSLLGGRAGGGGGLGGLAGLGGGGGGGGLGGLGGLLGGLLGGGGAGSDAGTQQVPQLTPQDAERLSPEEVQELATRAEQHNPGIIDQMSSYYAKNPQLFKALGGAALAVALGQIAQRRR